MVLALAAALASDAGGGPSALVELQVAPRGLGSVSATPPGRDSDGQVDTEPCTNNNGQHLCRWFFDAGTKVKLTASPDPAPAKSRFLGWSTLDCPGTGACTVTLDTQLTTVVARFSPVALGVLFSEDSTATVSTVPAGEPCQWEPHDPGPDVCVEFAPGTSVRVTLKSSEPFDHWNPGCEPRSSTTCTVVVQDEPTWIGANFKGDDPVQLPTTIKVRFRLKKEGSGGGRVTASGLDCGGSCAATFDYGDSLALKATPDSGSVFDGWNGVCDRTQTTCTFPVGPITSIRARFARDSVAPATPGGLQVTSASRTTLVVSWGAATDNDRVVGYRVYLDDVSAGDTTETQFAFQGLKCGSKHVVSVDAVDPAGNRSPKATLTARTKLCPFAMRLAAVGVARSKTGREVVVRLRASRNTSARLELTAQRRRVAGKRFPIRPGTNVLRLPLPPTLAAGSYRLSIAVANPDGGTRTLSRTVTVPPAQ